MPPCRWRSLVPWDHKIAVATCITAAVPCPNCCFVGRGGKKRRTASRILLSHFCPFKCLCLGSLFVHCDEAERFFLNAVMFDFDVALASSQRLYEISSFPHSLHQSLGGCHVIHFRVVILLWSIGGLACRQVPSASDRGVDSLAICQSSKARSCENEQQGESKIPLGLNTIGPFLSKLRRRHEGQMTVSQKDHATAWGKNTTKAASVTFTRFIKALFANVKSMLLLWQAANAEPASWAKFSTPWETWAN